MNSSTYEKSLLLSQPLREPVLRKAVQSMQLPESGYGLDIGCGTGLNTIMLAEAMGPAGRVVGLDNAEELLTKAKLLASESAAREGIDFIRGDAGNLPFPDKSFD